MDFIGSHSFLIAWVLTIPMVVTAAVFDIREFRVPNFLTLPMCVAGLLFHTVANGWQGLTYSFGGLMIGGLMLILFYVIGAIGAGDVKLLAGVGAWLGVPGTLFVFVVAALAAGVYSIVVLAFQRRLSYVVTWFMGTTIQLQTLGKSMAADDTVVAQCQRADRRRSMIPFAVMIAIGVVAAGFGNSLV